MTIYFRNKLSCFQYKYEKQTYAAASNIRLALKGFWF